MKEDISKRKYDLTTLKFISIFENITNAHVVDAFFNSQGVFVVIVEPGDAKIAIGRNGEKVKNVMAIIKKPIKIVEYNSDPVKFLSNLLLPLVVDSIESKDGGIIIKDKNREKRSLIIGRESQNLKELENIMKRFFDIKFIKVVG